MIRIVLFWKIFCPGQENFRQGSAKLKYRWLQSSRLKMSRYSLFCVYAIAGFLLDVIYVPIMICCIVNLFEKKNYKKISMGLNILGKYSTEIWFFHAVFFSTYVCDWFQPILKIVSWPPLLFVWLVLLSLIGAVVYQKILKRLQKLPRFLRRSL